MIRKPIVAGQFYEEDPHVLREEIKKFLSKVDVKGDSIGVISPHAGYIYSGQCAAYSFSSIKDADVYLVLGTSHSGSSSCISLDDFETPLGIVKNDNEFARKLIENGLKENKTAHSNEHSIEVQLPFLQFVKKNVSFVPAIIGDDYENVAEVIKKTIKEFGKKVVIIASGDFTHYGLNYGYFPFKDDVKENMYKLDNGAIDLIVKNDVKGFLDYCNKTGATICGKYVFACLMKILNKKGKLLKYYTSGDVSRDYSSACGYASIVF